MLWLYLDEGFVYINLVLVKTLLGFFGYQTVIPEKLALYPHTFNTFHLIAYTSLILATGSVDRSKKLRGLVAGLIILWVSYFLFKLHQALYLDFHVRYAFRPFIALIIVNQWFLPFALWLFFVRHELFGTKSNRK
jgi:hypothetical protein